MPDRIALSRATSSRSYDGRKKAAELKSSIPLTFDTNQPLNAVWRATCPPARLEARSVHVWRADLDVQGRYSAELTSLLSSDELERANRFRFKQHRIHYSVGRGLLRVLIGRYLACRPSALSFRYASRGKPYLCRFDSLSFNLSHSGGMALYAFTNEGELGIDLEKHDSELRCEEIAKNFFAPDEVGFLEAASAEGRPQRFFELWSRKEAYLKALANGLSTPLHEFSVAGRASLEGFELYSFDVGPGFAAALAVKPKPESILFFDADRLALR